MMKNKILFITLLFLTIPFISFSQQEAIQKGLDVINKDVVKSQLEFLSSDWMEGRATGEKGEFIAADYLASMLQFMGIQPAGDKAWTEPTRKQRWNGIRSEEYTSYYQNIYMTSQSDSKTSFSISFSNNQTINFKEKIDFSSYGTDIDMNFSSDIIFVGYGFTDEESGYDDYKGVDIKNKIIVRLYGFPGHKDTNSTGYKKFNQEDRYFKYYLNRTKDKIAKEKGALAIIDVYENDNSKYWAEEKDFNKMDKNEDPWAPIYEDELSIPSKELKIQPIKIFPSKKLINKILEGQNINIEQYEKKQANNLKPDSKKLKNISANISSSATRKLVHARNVVGIIEGENKDEIIVIGGHYDHLGIKDGFIWNGADDNASGTVGVWTLAKAFAATGIKPKKTIVFAAWTGEEKGLLGSKYFAENPYGGKIENIKLYLNFDMISKDSDTDSLKNKARMTYTSSLEQLEEKTKQRIEEHNLNLDLSFRSSKKPRGGSDHSSFSAKNVPIMYFMAGFPITYHTPKDGTEDINYEKMIDIIKLSFLNLWEVANKE